MDYESPSEEDFDNDSEEDFDNDSDEDCDQDFEKDCDDIFAEEYDQDSEEECDDIFEENSYYDSEEEYGDDSEDECCQDSEEIFENAPDDVSGSNFQGDLPYGKYKQFDPRWKEDKIKDKTLGKVGCAITSVANGLISLGIDTNPKKLNQTLKNDGCYQGNCIIWGGVQKRHNVAHEGQTYDINKIKQSIRDGKMVVACVKGGNHWVLATGYDEGGIFSSDPGTSHGDGYYKKEQVSRAQIYRKK